MAAPAYAAPGPVELAARSIETLLASARQPVLVEPGEPAFALDPEHFHLERSTRWLRLEVWDDHRVLNRRVTALRTAGPGKLTLETETLGGRHGQLLLYDEARPQNQALNRKATQWTGATLLERLLARHFPGYTRQRLSSGADLEHSLSPAFPRACLVRGREAWAAMLAPGEPEAARLVSFALIWHHYLRTQMPHLQWKGIALFLPEGTERQTALRLRHLNPNLAQYRLFAFTELHGAHEIDPADAGNVLTTLGAASTAPKPRLDPEALLEWSLQQHVQNLDARLHPAPVYSQVQGLTGSQEGLFDLLAADLDGRLTILELKATENLHLPVQALDYYIRTCWHLDRQEFARQGYFPGISLSPRTPRILLAAPAHRFHSTTEIIAGYFHPSIEIEIAGLSRDLAAPPKVLFRRRLSAHRPAGRS